ncbi:MAG: AIR synthase related protein, partial [Methyloceanibacter sp.]
AALAHAAPVYERPWTAKPQQALIDPRDMPAPNSIFSALQTLMGSPALSSRRWIWEQYDHMVMADTVQRPGGDAAVVRVHGTSKSLAISCDVTPRYCAADAREGARQAVAECWRNLTAVGADPLAITDCMNFGNPERPEIMGEFAEAVEGMAEACTALSFPVVSGNVSLYNETNGVAIPPTPAIGGIGLIPEGAPMARLALKRDGDVLLLLGAEAGHLGQSLYQQVMLDRSEGAPPPVDLDQERSVGDLVRRLIREGNVSAVHDVSDGGLLVAIAAMALAGGRGVELEHAPDNLPAHAAWFGEDQARYVVAASPDKADAIHKEAAMAKVPVRLVGKVGGEALSLVGEASLPLAPLKSAHEDWLPHFMAHG